MGTILTNTVKTDLGIRNDYHYDQINLAINTAKAQMMMRGVTVINETDPTTVICVELYCRYWFNFQGEAQRFFQAFEFLANAMAISSEYGENAAKHGEGEKP